MGKGGRRFFGVLGLDGLVGEDRKMGARNVLARVCYFMGFILVYVWLSGRCGE